jgi:type I restriction enzyme S subunit
MKGSVQVVINLADLRRVEVPIPPLSIQSKIVAILSAYDDLIENNLRRIKILEEMAQNLYREWFVKFRFPGHQDTRFVDSPLGPIPEGWEVRKLGEIADVRWGDTSTTKKSYVEAGYPAYSAAGKDGKLDHFDFDREGIVLSAIGANCGNTWYTKGRWSCIKNTMRLWATDHRIATKYLYLATLGQDFWPKRGAAQPFISQGDANEIPILVPIAEVGKVFDRNSAPIFDQTWNLGERVALLRGARDLLLPKLISGELDVSYLAIAVPEEVAA